MNRSSIYHWGPSGWNFLHAVSYSFPVKPSEEEKHDMYNFLRYFARVIPCKMCRDDFGNYIRTHLKNSDNPALKSKQQLVYFLVDAHNYVNVKIGKRIYSYAEVDKLYYTNMPPPNFLLPKLVCILIIAVLIILSLRWKTRSHFDAPIFFSL